MAGLKVTVTTSDSEVFAPGEVVHLLVLKNTGSYPITLDTVAPVVADTGIVLEAGESIALDAKTNGVSLQKLRGIAVG